MLQYLTHSRPSTLQLWSLSPIAIAQLKTSPSSLLTLCLKKHLYFDKETEELVVEYHLINQSEQSQSLYFSIQNEWTLDYLSLLSYGKEVIQTDLASHQVTLWNKQSSVGLKLTVSPEFERIVCQDSFIGYQTNPEMTVTLAPQEEKTYELRILSIQNKMH